MTRGLRALSLGVIAALASCTCAPKGDRLAAADRRVPAYRVVHTFPANTALSAVGSAIIACDDDCDPHLGASPPAPTPRTWWVTGSGETEDTSLWPIGAYTPAELPGSLQFARVRHFGAHPDNLWATIESFDYASGGYTHIAPVKRAGRGWERHGGAPDLHVNAPRPPHELDDALVHSPWAPTEARIVYGGKGPPLLFDEGRVATWTGSRWTVKEVPWREVYGYEAIRLASGATLVPATGGVYWMAADGAIAAVETEGRIPVDPGHPIKTRILAVNGAAWIAVTSAAGVTVLTPKNPEQVMIAERPPKPSYVPMPRSSEPGSIPPPEPFTPGCTAPFVSVQIPSFLGKEDPHVGPEERCYTALRGHAELQDEITFVEVVRDDETYLGAQAKTEDAARKVLSILADRGAGPAPEIGCLDVLARVPDRRAPPRGVRVLIVNLTTGELFNP